MLLTQLPAFCQLRPDEVTAPANDDAEIKELLRDALEIQAKPSPTAAELDKEIDYFQQILAIQSNHQVAYDGLKSAIAQKQALVGQQTQEGQKKSAGAAAAQKSQQAFLSGDLAGADEQLKIAQKNNPDDPTVIRMAERIKDAYLRQQRQRLVMMLTGGVVLLAIFAFAVKMIRSPRIPFIEFLDGSDKRVPLDRDVVKVGSISGEGDRKNDVVLSDPDGMVSRYHCEFRNNRNKIFRVECNSRNGTTVDDRRVPPQRLVPLRNGSRIGIAMTNEFRLVFERKK